MNPEQAQARIQELRRRLSPEQLELIDAKIAGVKAEVQQQLASAREGYAQSVTRMDQCAGEIRTYINESETARKFLSEHALVSSTLRSDIQSLQRASRARNLINKMNEDCVVRQEEELLETRSATQGLTAQQQENRTEIERLQQHMTELQRRMTACTTESAHSEVELAHLKKKLSELETEMGKLRAEWEASRKALQHPEREEGESVV